MAWCDNCSQLKDSINSGSRDGGGTEVVRGGVWSVFSLLLPSLLLKSYLKFLWAAGMARMICLLSRASCHRAAGEQQPKDHRQTATWIWVKDETVMFESQPEEAARAVQMFPLSFWQRQHQEGKSRGDRRLPGSRGQRAELLPSRELHKSPLWPLPVFNILWVTMILEALP